MLAVMAILASCTANSPEREDEKMESSSRSSVEQPNEASKAESKSDQESKDKQAAEGDQEESANDPDVVFVPTPQPAVEKMLEMANIESDDLLYDLGCGDGRIVVTAAKKYGIEAVGIDIDPVRVKEARQRVKENDVEDLVTIKQRDLFEVDFSDADVVTLYLLPGLNKKLKPKLAQLEPGSRIVSYDFEMAGAKPDEVYKSSSGDEWTGTIYKWVVPWEKETK